MNWNNDYMGLISPLGVVFNVASMVNHLSTVGLVPPNVGLVPRQNSLIFYNLIW